MATKRKYSRKKCKRGRVRSRKTKRCRKISKRKKCKSGYKRRRSDKRCIKRKCKKGRTRDRVTKKCRRKKKSGKKKKKGGVTKTLPKVPPRPRRKLPDVSKLKSSRARKNWKELAKKAKITNDQAKQHINSIMKGTNYVYITDKSGNIARQNTTKKPLILRKFGIKRIANKKLLTDGYKNYKGNIFNRVPKNNRPVKLRFNITAGIQFSNDYETRTFETIKTVAPNQINQEYKANVIREFYSIDNDTNIDIISFKE